MNPKQKDGVRGSNEWPIIAKYYNERYDAIQRNAGEHLFRQKYKYEPRGKIEYHNKVFISLEPSIPKEEKWELGPDGFYHEPQCSYRKRAYEDWIYCRCYAGRKRKMSKSAAKESTHEGGEG